MSLDTTLQSRLERLAGAEQKSLDEVIASLLEEALEIRESGVDPRRFFSAFLHEVRTPLASLMMVSELLADLPSTQGEPKAERYVSMLNETLAETSQLVNQVGDLVRSTNRPRPPGPQTLSLAEMLEDLSSAFRDRRSMGDPTLEIRGASEIPKGARVDRNQSPRILRDLIDWVAGSTSADVVFLDVACKGVAGSVPQNSSAPATEFEGQGGVLMVKLGPVTGGSETWFRPFETKSLRRRVGSQRQTGLELLTARVRARALGGSLEAVEDDLSSQLILSLPLLFLGDEAPAAGLAPSPTT